MKRAAYEGGIPMLIINKKNAFLLFSLLASCGMEETLLDIPSPDGDYHVVVQKCPQRGSFFWTRDTMIQVSVLPSGASEDCNAFINSVHQFDGYAPHDQLELDWTAATKLRVWHPAYETSGQPYVIRSKSGNPIEVTFSPRT